MTTTTPRERVQTALEHRESDRVPIDLGSGQSSGIHARTYARLIELLGIQEEIVLFQKAGQLARPSERVLEWAGADVRGVVVGDRQIRPPSVRKDATVDEWGVESRMAPSATCYAPVGFPLRNATLKDVESYPWPNGKDPLRVAEVATEIRSLHEQTPYATFAHLSWAPFSRSQGLMGYDAFLEALVLQPVVAESVAEHIHLFMMDLAASFLDRAAPFVDVVALSDDFSTQRGPTISPGRWRELFRPRLKQYIDLVHSKTKAKVWFHSCGSVYWVIRDLVDCGVEILNPVQVCAADMDTARLKREFGKDLSFWGAIDTQQVLPFGTPDQVRDEVKRRIRDLAPGGGYVLASCHNIEADVPGENVQALFQAAQRWGGYPLRIT